MPSEIFPLNFPSELRATCFRADNEVAWPPMLAAAAVEWLCSNGYAVLGTELWLLKGESIQSLPVGASGMREVHGNTVNRGNEEPWSAFVARSEEETRACLQGFKPSEIAEPGQSVFNVVWASEAKSRICPRVFLNSF
jgi:hypothetical protein